MNLLHDISARLSSPEIIPSLSDGVPYCTTRQCPSYDPRYNVCHLSDSYTNENDVCIPAIQVVTDRLRMLESPAATTVEPDPRSDEQMEDRSGQEDLPAV